MKIVFVGGGNMASALIGGLVARGHARDDIRVVDPSQAARDKVSAQHGIEAIESANATVLADAVCVLAVKPQVMQPVASGLAESINGNLVISVAAGIRATDLSRWLGGHQRIVRAMPNTPALIGQGVTGLYCASEGADADNDRKQAQAILSAVGEAIWVAAETDLDAVTAISGSGPAYVFRWMEAMQVAGEQLGLTAEQTQALVQQTVRGAAELAIQSDEPVGVLRENVTSKGGTTAAGLNAMNESGIEAAIVNGVRAAHARSVEMGDEFGSD